MSERQGGNNTDPWNGHQTTCRLVRLCQAAHLFVEFALLPANVLVDRQKWIDDGAKLMIFRHQFDDLVPELQADRSSEEQPILLDHAADLILDISAYADQTRSSDENGTNLLALFALDLDLAVPTHSDQFGEALRVILILRSSSARAPGSDFTRPS